MQRKKDTNENKKIRIELDYYLFETLMDSVVKMYRCVDYKSGLSKEGKDHLIKAREMVALIDRSDDVDIFKVSK